MSKSGIFPSDDWAVVEGETPTGPMFLRFRQSNPSESDRNLFNKLIIARWAFPPRDHTGLPSAELIEQMDQFETTIVDASDADGHWGSCVAVITHAGMRKWRFYTPTLISSSTNSGNVCAHLGLTRSGSRYSRIPNGTD